MTDEAVDASDPMPEDGEAHTAALALAVGSCVRFEFNKNLHVGWVRKLDDDIEEVRPMMQKLRHAQKMWRRRTTIATRVR